MQPATNAIAERTALLVAWLAIGACQSNASGPAERALLQGSAEIGGAVVSTVDGHPIFLSEVEALAKQGQLSAREALRRLQAERLLMLEALRRGTSGREVERVARRASVHALLDAEAQAQGASEEELQRAYAGDARFHLGERRASVHILAKVGRKATDAEDEVARKIAQAAIAELDTQEIEVLRERYSGVRQGLQVKLETLPSTTREGAFVPEFLEGLFSIPGPGVVPEPVRTKFGWHAIRVTEVIPPTEVPYEQAAFTLRKEIELAKRTARVAELLEALRRKHGVAVQPSAVDKLAAIDSLSGLRSR